MIPPERNRKVVIGGALPKANSTFGISSENHDWIIEILRDNIYSNAVLAVIRETFTNARDAHRSVGKGDLPVKIRLPTEIDPIFVCRDYGPGLSEQDMLNTFTQYGMSTRRTSNDYTGFFGIGSKCPFAVSETFHIISYYEGTKTTYVAHLDEKQRGILSKVHEAPCGDETGLEIRVPVPNEKVHDFREEAANLFRFVTPKPDINIEIPPVSGIKFQSEHGLLFERRSFLKLAVVDGIPYTIPHDQAKRAVENAEVANIQSFFEEQWAIFPDPKDVDITPSRESLKYTDRTLAAIRQTLTRLFQDLEQHVHHIANRPDWSNFEKRLALARIGTCNIKWPKDINRYMQWHSYITPRTFKLKRVHQNQSSATNNIFINKSIKIFVGRRVLNFGPESYYVAYPNKAGKDGVEQAKRELDQILKDNLLDGIPVLDVPSVPRKKKRSKPYSNNTLLFAIKGTTLNANKPSEQWEPVDGNPRHGSPFLFLDRFQAVGMNNPEKVINALWDLQDILGEDKTPVYGVRILKRHPMTKEKVKSEYGLVPFTEWVNTFIEQRWTREHVAALFVLARNRVSVYRDLKSTLLDQQVAQDNPIVQHVSKMLDIIDQIPNAKDIWSLVSLLVKACHLSDLMDALHDMEREAISGYPLIRSGASMSDLLFYATHKAWAHYIKLVDNYGHLLPYK